MELTFVVDALRRYFWVIPIAAVLGMLPGVALVLQAEPTYIARSVLLVVPPRENRVEITFGGNNDRYIESELASMGSRQLARVVAERMADGTTPEAVMDAVSFVHPPQTDIVQVAAETSDPATSQRIANTLAQAYLDRLFDDIEDTRSPGVDRIEVQLNALSDQLAEVDADIEAAMRPFITPSVDAEGEAPPVPAVEQVAPALSTRKAILIAQYNQLLTAQTELDLDPDLQVASELVQEAPLPEFPVASRRNLLAAAGFVAGAFMGLLLAVVLARLSPRLLSSRQAEPIVGAPVIGPIPTSRSAGLAEVLAAPPPSLLRAADAICVRAEAADRAGSGLTVAVVGSERPSSSSTLAAAMANRFAAHGLSTVLADADLRHPEITRALVPGADGISDVLGRNPDTGTTSAGDRLEATLAPSTIDDVSLLGVGEPGSATAMRNDWARDLMSSAAGLGQVVVIDAGAASDASSSVQLGRLADVVVLAIPHRAHLAMLESATSQLANRRGDLIPVSTSRPSILDRLGLRSVGSVSTVPSRGDSVDTGVPADAADADVEADADAEAEADADRRLPTA